jgi:hypothetical protein
MSNPDSDGGPQGEFNERDELEWNEFDWERYLREQDAAVARYRKHYEARRRDPDRIDTVAEAMGWSCAGDDEADEIEDDDEVYTLHQNPIFVATRGIFGSLTETWRTLAADPRRASQEQGVALLDAIHRAEHEAMQAVYVLDFGDYAMAVSLFKRSLTALNAVLALIYAEGPTPHRAFVAWREEAVPRLFDLREIWLRVMAECREELERPVDDES